MAQSMLENYDRVDQLLASPPIIALPTEIDETHKMSASEMPSPAAKSTKMNEKIHENH